MKKSLLVLVSICCLCLLSACGSGASGGNSGGKGQPLTITSAAPPPGGVQTAYGAGGSGFSLAAAGGLPPYIWVWAAASGSALPPGLNLASSGLISGTPTSAGNFMVQVTVRDSASPPSQQIANDAIDISAALLTITSPAPPGGTIGIVYDGRFGPTCKPGTPNCVCIPVGPNRPVCRIAEHGFQLNVAGGTPPYSWNWAAAAGSALPPGLALSPTGLIGGVPTSAGSYQLVVAVSDSSMLALQNATAYTVMIAPPPPPHIETLNSPSAVVNLAYSFTLDATGGELPLTWSATGAAPGLSLSSDGVLSGKPTATGAFPITVMVQDSAGQNATPQNFVVEVTSHGFAMTGSMNSARISHTATLLNDGTVLIVGGQDSNGLPVKNSELYTPSSGTFAVTGALGTARYFHTSTLLVTGKVLVAGGDDISGNAIASAELYDPATKTFTPVSNMVSARDFYTATLLGNGKVLLAGGGNLIETESTAELFDPSTGTFCQTGSMSTPRAAHTATLLSSGKVLVTGGGDRKGNVYATAELYDPSSGTFAPTTGGMNDQRYAHTATLLGNSSVLIAGGTDATNSAIASVEIYNANTGNFAATGSMGTPRSAHRAILLNDGTVLVEGGTDENGAPLVAAELYDQGTGLFAPTGSLQSPRFRHTATLLSSGIVLVTGGANTIGTLATSEFYQ